MSDPPDTTDPPESPPTTAADSPIGPTDDELAAQIEAVLTAMLDPTSIRWDARGVDLPPTAAVAAVRIPGRDDLLVAVGENVDGTPVEVDASFGVAHLTTSLVQTIAFQLIDEGVLDPDRTVDEWVPTLPNADRVTVQMLIDDETGWSNHDPIEPDPVVSDFGRVWSQREIVELQAAAMTALDEPGTRTDDGLANFVVLGLVVEEVGGQPLADLVHDRVSVPAGLDHTGLAGDSGFPTAYRHGVFPFNGSPVVTSAFDPTSFLTWEQATNSVVSTPTDLLDLLDAWATSALFTTDRTPAPQRFVAELDDDGNVGFLLGRGVPFNGWCPCTEVDGGFEPTAFGRAPWGIGMLTYLFRYADGISVVLNANSREVVDGDDIEAVVNTIHDLAAGANGS